MLKSYFIIATRHLTKQKLFSFINIFCLALGITFSMLIGIYVLNEKEINADIKNINRQYVIKSDWKQQNMGESITTLGPLAKTMKDEYPGLVENYYRFNPVVNIVSVGNKHFRTPISVGDTTLVSMFGFPLLFGNPAKAFRNNLSAVVTEEFARKFFGKTDVIDQAITVQTPADGNKHQFVITAVLKSLPYNSVTNFTTTPYEVFLPMDANQYFQGGDKGDNWSNIFIVGMIELKKGVVAADLAKPFGHILEKYQPPFVRGNLKIQLTAMRDYYLKDNDNAVQKMLIALGSIAGLILLLAIINFININIGTSVHRLKEMGLRKVLGGLKIQLIIQHITEAVVLTLGASFISLLLYELLLPAFSQLLNASFSHFWQLGWSSLLFVIVLITGVGILAGIYPAFILSSFDTVTAVKGKMNSGKGGIAFRKILLVVQFMLAIVVCISAINVSKQVSYFFNKDIGYNKEQVMVISSLPREFDSAGVIKMEDAKLQLFNVPGVENVTLSYDIPDGSSGGYTTMYAGGNDFRNVMLITADADFAKVYDLTLKEGSFLPNGNSDYVSGHVVLNETAVKALGWTTAVGKTIKLGAWDGPEETVVGVVKDFHMESLQKNVQPLIIVNPNEPFARVYRYFSVKLNAADVRNTINSLQEKFKTSFPDAGFEYFFMDKKFQSIYESEIRLKKATSIATILNFVIVFMGIFGIVAFTLAKRNKEIAVRKVLGARAQTIIAIFLKEYGILIFIANLIAWPAAYIINYNWLENYAYRIHQNVFTYLIAMLSMFVTAFILITIQCFNTANSNPGNSLKAE